MSRVFIPGICTFCQHFNDASLKTYSRSCQAFPDEIPLDIWNGYFNHQNPYPDDMGIQFLKREESAMTLIWRIVFEDGLNNMSYDEIFEWTLRELIRVHSYNKTDEGLKRRKEEQLLLKIERDLGFEREHEE